MIHFSRWRPPTRSVFRWGIDWWGQKCKKMMFRTPPGPITSIFGIFSDFWSILESPEGAITSKPSKILNYIFFRQIKVTWDISGEPCPCTEDLLRCGPRFEHFLAKKWEKITIFMADWFDRPYTVLNNCDSDRELFKAYILCAIGQGYQFIMNLGRGN